MYAFEFYFTSGERGMESKTKPSVKAVVSEALNT